MPRGAMVIQRAMPVDKVGGFTEAGQLQPGVRPGGSASTAGFPVCSYDAAYMGAACDQGGGQWR